MLRLLICFMVLLYGGIFLWPDSSLALSGLELMNLSLEELMEVEVSSVGRKLQKVSESPAAVFVLNREDIRRSGATSIPEALRMVPGLSVARIDGSTWAVAGRGFNGRFLNKMQVLIDGRSVYSPPFSTVYWDMQDTLLEDVERIEVVRGPGGTLWGANAVNGVINVITKSARDTQGALVVTGTGTEEQGFSSLRYGGQVGDQTYYRAFVKYFDRGRHQDGAYQDSKYAAAGQFGEAHDDWSAFRGGFRVDGSWAGNNDFSLQGEIFNGTAGTQKMTPSFVKEDGYFNLEAVDTSFSGGFLLGRWQRQLAATGDLALQIYYDRGRRDEEALANSEWNVFDLDFQHRFVPARDHELLWGFGYRLTLADLEDGDLVKFHNSSATDQLFSLFIQDEIALLPDTLHLLIGSKFEHNDYTGFEYQPNLRLIWTPNPRHSLWGAVSRAVRTPSQMESAADIHYAVIPENFLFPTNDLPAKIVLSGTKDFSAEKSVSYELGYRFMPGRAFSIDTALFYSRYREHRSGELGAMALQTEPIVHFLVEVEEGNKVEAEAYGMELAVDWRLSDWWRLRGHYSLLKLNTWASRNSSDVYSSMLYENSSPQQQWSVRSSFDMGRNWDLDLWLRYVDPVSVYIIDVDHYYSLDMRVAWRPLDGLELSLVGQNLLETQHTETQAEFGTVSTAVPRGVYGQITWQF